MLDVRCHRSRWQRTIYLGHQETNACRRGRHRVSHGGDFGTTSDPRNTGGMAGPPAETDGIDVSRPARFTAFLADRGTRTAPNHRAIAGDSPAAEAIKVLARGHENLIWFHTRRTAQRITEYYPAALEAFDGLADRDALAIRAALPPPPKPRI